MPTTPNGTEYTYEAQQIDDEVIRWGVATAAHDTPAIPALIYCHGNGGTSDSFHRLNAWAGLRNWWLDYGGVFIEGTGGGPSEWGGPRQRIAYELQHEYVSTELDLGPVIVLGRSMGGLVSYWLTTQSTFADKVAGLIVNSGVTDMAYRYTYGNDLNKRQFRAAFGADDDAEFWDLSEGYDPMLFPTDLWANKQVIQLFGTADDVVEGEHHAVPWGTKYGPHCRSISFKVREGGDHSGANGSYLDVDAMTDFIQNALMADTSAPGGLDVPFVIPAVHIDGSVVAEVTGNAPAKASLRIDGPVIFPEVHHLESGRSLTFDLILEDDQWLEIDLDRRTVLLNGQASRRGRMRGQWFELTPGTNTLAFAADSNDRDASLTVTWRDAYR